MNEQQFSAYLEKVGLTHKPSVTMTGLLDLHRAQLLTIPFENFDIALGRGVSLRKEDLYRKLLGQKRGGYCFELNELMFEVLRFIGFEAQRVLARVHLSGEPTGRSHQVTMVELDGEQLLVDNGFGSATPRTPLKLSIDEVIHTDLQTLRFTLDDDFGYMLQQQNTDDSGSLIWKNLYSFDLEHVCEADIRYGNYYVSTYPESHFVTSRIAALPTPDGLITLLNHRIKVVSGGETQEIELASGQSYLDALQRYFSIELDSPYSDLTPIS
ncbi:arylamine N-acetyltransferase [Vibrio sp. SCSIO 43135]|uniref:arylamine N-acetyltransferase family protein n=1 Tax=Vibrio sp. SCSIO 43135 TaxID=2819096 RepID=UPI0020762133|nr:arylamine N-acetyltransferase [Vibrio sp. SCSIO 43135]USD43076.1 arylamine N-acetyltransferase [Vibrio sp. SCSIO 43135]